jgi:hypothetical protein
VKIKALKSDSSRRRPCRSSEKGIALLAVVVCFLIFIILGLSVLSTVNNEIVLARGVVNKTKAFYAAEAGIEYGVAKLNELLSENRQAVDLCEEADISAHFQIPSPTLDGFNFDVFTIEKVGGSEMRTINSGPCTGMEAFIQKYRITSQVTSNGPRSTSETLVQWIEDQKVSLFQFAAFYDQDLELEPGASMTIKGRIHSNHDVYLGCNDTLSIDSYLTSACNIYRGNKPGDTDKEGGKVQIKDSNGDYKIMDFDSTDPDWATKAINTWGGKVLSQVHAIPELKLPISVEDDPIEIIKRGDVGDSETLKDARFYWQADLRIIDDVAYDKSGNVVNLTYNDGGSVINPVDISKSFHNYREGKDIKVTEIDISKLAASGKFPVNGILYVSTHLAGSGQQDGVRLVNGSSLPSGGLTVASDNPLYIKGDYNLNKAPASVLCDAVNILSNNWQDGNVCPLASNTQVNSCIVAGHTTTSYANGYGGGLENLPRLLENWDGVTFKWSGSIDSLWYSEIATGKWIYGSPYYTAPIRDWEFDQQLLNVSKLPPGTPVICISHRSGWEEVFE